MSIRESLLAQLRRFDDEAWAALASRGLLRRAHKDLESVEPSVSGGEDASLQVHVGPHVVVFDAGGPAQASCSCPSGSTCQHIIAAGLWLAAQATTPSSAQPPAAHAAPVSAPAPGSAAAETGSAATGSPSAEGAADARDEADDRRLHDELMGFDTAALVAHAGRPGHRWATQFLTDLDPEAGVRVEPGRHTSISFASPRVTLRYMGGGLAALVADSRLPAIEKYQVAAVLAYQRAHGADLAPTQQPRGRATASDLSLAESRRRLRASTSRLLEDTVRLGLSHLSPGVHQRYETVSVWAQGAEYHRLALLLRRLADHVELLLERSARADEHRLLDEAATAYALLAALEAAGPAPPPRLLGAARNRYDAVRTMELLGLGAVPWRAASGYRGLTTMFWWPSESRFVSLTEARPETLRGFDPRRVYESPGPWRGLGAPSAATGARVRLTDAQLSVSGRLSGVGRTHASITPLAGRELAAELPTVAEWSALEHRPGVGLLDAPDPLRAWAVVAPAVFGAARFDPVGQELTWPVFDGSGSALRVSVPYSPETAHLIGLLERLAAVGVPEGTLLVCRVRTSAAGLTAEPLSLIHPGRLAPESPVVALHFHDPAAAEADTSAARSHGAQPRASSSPSGLALGGPVAEPPEAGPSAGVVPQPAALHDLRLWLLRQAERGTGAAPPGVVSSELLARHRRLRDIGLDLFPITTQGEDPAVLLLRSHFIVRQVNALISGEPET